MAKGTLPADAARLVKAARSGPQPVASSIICAWRERAWTVFGMSAAACEASPAASAAAELPVMLLLACAVFHLPGLRQAMRRELRYARYDRLARVLPRVWWATNDILPPGSVIAGLGIGAWSDLPTVLAQGRRFEQITLAADGRELGRTAVTGAILPVAEDEISLLRELPNEQPFDGWVQASYEVAETGRWGLSTAQQWRPEEQRWGEVEVA